MRAAAHFSFTMNTTGIQLYFMPADVDVFYEICENTDTSEKFPGLMEGNFIGEPDTLNDEKLRDKKFFGMHGAHAGAYPAHVFCSTGKEIIYTHPADEDGNLSLFTSDPFRLGDLPIQIPTRTLQFILVAQGLVKLMLDEVAEAMAARMKEIEAEEEAKRKAEAEKEGDTPEPQE